MGNTENPFYAHTLNRAYYESTWLRIGTDQQLLVNCSILRESVKYYRNHENICMLSVAAWGEPTAST
jgi:hypothetical protein